jgi:hypothetical protein
MNDKNEIFEQFSEIFNFEKSKNKKEKVNNKNKTQRDFSNEINKAIIFISNLSKNKRNLLIELLKEVQKIQNSTLSTSEKALEIKKIMWTNQSRGAKYIIGSLLGTIGGLFIFGTGGIGIVGLGGAIGGWGFLAGTAGGLFISSLIQNFENNK